MPEDIVNMCSEAVKLPGIELYGIGNELSCYAGIVPDDENMTRFAALVHEVEDVVGFRLPAVSGGSSVSVRMLQERRLPPEINHLRIGEAIIIGTIANYGDVIDGGCTDNLFLTAEIIEIKKKPSKPHGSRVPGELPVAEDASFPDRGTRLRALVAVGKQDVDIRHLKPCDIGVEILEGCSDCCVVDISDARLEYRVGDVMRFSMDYYSMLPAMVSSEYIEKILV
jgi:predicted amino acid racemase